jgi:hypothetical protein
MIKGTSIKARRSVLGATYLARISLSFLAACTNHTFADVVRVIDIAAIFSCYDWNFHILQVVWQLGFFLNSEGKNTGSATTIHCELLYYNLCKRTVTLFPCNMAACPFLDYFVTYLEHTNT